MWHQGLQVSSEASCTASCRSRSLNQTVCECHRATAAERTWRHRAGTILLPSAALRTSLQTFPKRWAFPQPQLTPSRGSFSAHLGSTVWGSDLPSTMAAARGVLSGHTYTCWTPRKMQNCPYRKALLLPITLCLSMSCTNPPPVTWVTGWEEAKRGHSPNKFILLCKAESRYT